MRSKRTPISFECPCAITGWCSPFNENISIMYHQQKWRLKKRIVRLLRLEQEARDAV